MTASGESAAVDEQAAAAAGPATDQTAGFPAAPVPDRLFEDPGTDRRWRERFTAVRASLPTAARDNDARTVLVSNRAGTFEIYCWDTLGGQPLQCTDRPNGTTSATLSANGEGLWWFADTDGDEFGSWMAQPFGSAPGSAGEALPGVAPGYAAGIEVGSRVVLAGFNDDDGTRIHLVRNGSAAEVVYRHETDGSVGALSTDETIWVLQHSEHGDSRYPALRALDLSTGAVRGELDDTPGKGLSAIEFSPVPGDQRLLVNHERAGRDELLVWDIDSGEVTELPIDLPGELSGSFFPDGKSVLVVHDHHGRSTLHRFDLGSGRLTTLPTPAGTIADASTRRDGSVWFRVSSPERAARSMQLDAGHPQGRSVELRLFADPQAPDSQPLHDLWTEGRGGRIHSLLAVPPGVALDPESLRVRRPLPCVFLVHGGPDAADDHSFDAERALWLDAGFAVVQVNYRGSSGYGAAWRDAITERIGHTELADLAAVQDDLLRRGTIDSARCVLAGASWGGYLTLLGLGVQPSRWAVGIAGVPVADYVASYAEEMEPLRAYDRALFGGSPDEVPDKYADSSPASYLGRVGAPVLILAGVNDPRCPWGQIERYLHGLQRRGADFALYRYDAGHGSARTDERVRQAAVEVAFARQKLWPDRRF